MKHNIRHAAFLVGIVVIGIAFGVAVRYLFSPWLTDLVVPASGPIERWIAGFEELATGLVIASTILAILWYALAAWVFRVEAWRGGYKRFVWALLLGVGAAAALFVGFITPPFERGGPSIYAAYLVLGVALYYLATLLFSPANHKYAPLGASTLRRW